MIDRPRAAALSIGAAANFGARIGDPSSPVAATRLGRLATIAFKSNTSHRGIDAFARRWPGARQSRSGRRAFGAL
jgi:hypothetical protein